MTGRFVLDATLARDSTPVGDLPLCAVRLMADARYPWLVLVPRRAGLVELIDLAPDERARLIEEIAQVSQVLKAATGCHKLNVAALGNQVRQLHVHVVARFEGDAAWPRPVWGVGTAVAYGAGVTDGFIAALRRHLAL